VHVRGATLVVNPQLEDIAVAQLEGTRFLICARKADAVEEGAGGGFRILDEKLSPMLAPHLGVCTRDNLGFENKRIRTESIDSSHVIMEAADKTAYAQSCTTFKDITHHRLKTEGGTAVNMTHETDMMTGRR
jgi:hypothetical protein